MTALWIILGIVIYLAGFTATARTANLLDRRFDMLGEGEDQMLAIMWPLALLVVIVAGPLVLLYRFATHDLRDRP